MIKNNLTLALFPIISMLIIITSLTIIASAYAQGLNVTERPKFFAIQHANSGSISEINKTFTLSLNNESNKTLFSSNIDKSFLLELYNVSDKTILFSDRTDRIVTSVSTSDFIGNWSTGEDSFAMDAPNAVLVVDDIDVQQDTAIVELFNPVYDLDVKTLKYDITTDNTTSVNMTTKFEQVTLLIDTGSNQGVVAE